MVTMYDNIEVDTSIVISNLNRIQSQIFRLLPAREENME